jgi:hypothetical protein
VGAEEADANEPFLPGDRVWTNAVGRAEFQFPDGSLVRLDRRSKLDYSGHEEEGGERIVLRLWSGSLYLRVRTRDARFEIETPAGTVRGLERSLVRVDVDAGEARVSVWEGEALLEDAQATVSLAAGDRTYARWGDRAEEPQRFDLEEQDDFDRWNADQDAQDRWDGRSAQYLPDELDSYSGEFAAYGDWSYETTVGYVWVPRVAVDWRPYWHGRWCWTPYGWTWVPNERWGWVPSHYGRWGHGEHGWYWIPGRTWGPAWVSWAVGGGYVGWCPLGWRDRPVQDWDSQRRRYERGHAIPRSGRSGPDIEAWNVVQQGQLAVRDLAQRRVSVDRVDLKALQVAASARFRPTRDVRQLREAEPLAHAISTRPTPGDFVRELAVDNKTTIPAPWFRRAGATPRGNTQIRNERDHAAGSTVPGNTVPRSTVEGTTWRRAGEPASVGTAGPAENDRTTSQRRAPWLAPTANGEVRNASPATPSSDQRSFRRAPDSSEQETPRPWSESVAQPRAHQQAPAAPSTWRETERRQRDAPATPQPRVMSGDESRPSRNESAATSRQRDTGGGGSSRPSAESAAARPRGEKSMSSAAETRPSGDRSVATQRRDRR